MYMYMYICMILFCFFLTVVRSKCTSNVGLAGIVLQETQNTFRLINSDNRILSK